MTAILLDAYLPSTAPKMMEQLGLDRAALDLSNAVYGGQERYTVHKGEPLFPRIDVAKEIAPPEGGGREAPRRGPGRPEAKEEAEAKAAAPAAPAEPIEHEAEISFDDFCKVEMRVAEVRACETVKESKKLLHLTVFDGERERCILSGIAKWYKPEDLVGKKVGIVPTSPPVPC